MKKQACLLALLLISTGCVRRYHEPAQPQPCGPQMECEEPITLMDAIEMTGRPYQTTAHMRGRTDSIPADDITSARVLLRMESGSLQMKGGSDSLVKADLKYPAGGEPPELISLTSGDMRQVELSSLGGNNHWELALNPLVPMTVAIDALGGYRNLNFKDVSLTDFYLQALEGNSIVEVPGEHSDLSTFRISQDRGSVGVDMSGDYRLLADASIYTAHGDISGTFTGYYARLTQMDVTAIEGNVKLNLTGAWIRPLHLRVTATCGNTVLCIPCGLGTSVIVHKGPCATVNAPTFSKKWSNNGYVNEAFGKTKSFLDITVYITEGTLQVVEVADCCGCCTKL